MTTIDPGLDLGCGHWLRWVSWEPDRALNPQFDGIPDEPHAMVIIRHELQAGRDDREECRDAGYCEGVATVDGPVTRHLFTANALWQLVSAEPVTLTPSLLCHCGDHGMITAGRWVPA